MGDTQYDLSEKVLKLYHIKHKQRQEAKSYFAKFMNNPHRPLGEGRPFDPILFRYTAAQAYSYEHVKPTPRNVLLFMCVSLGPVLLLNYLINYEQTNKENKYRAGLVAYKDRPDRLNF